MTIFKRKIISKHLEYSVSITHPHFIESESIYKETGVEEFVYENDLYPLLKEEECVYLEKYGIFLEVYKAIRILEGGMLYIARDRIEEKENGSKERAFDKRDYMKKEAIEKISKLSRNFIYKKIYKEEISLLKNRYRIDDIEII